VFRKDLSESSVRGLNPATGVYKTPCINQTHHGGNLGRLTPAAPPHNWRHGANASLNQRESYVVISFYPDLSAARQRITWFVHNTSNNISFRIVNIYFRTINCFRTSCFSDAQRWVVDVLLAVGPDCVAVYVNEWHS